MGHQKKEDRQRNRGREQIREEARGQKRERIREQEGRTESKTDKRTPPSGEWRSQASECNQIIFAPKEQPADSSAAKES